jgi:hypothetical protein
MNSATSILTGNVSSEHLPLELVPGNCQEIRIILARGNSEKVQRNNNCAASNCFTL